MWTEFKNLMKEMDEIADFNKFNSALKNSLKLEKETFSVVKDGIETTIVVSFLQGYPVSFDHESKKFLSEKDKKLHQLNKDLETAISKKLFREAAEIQDRINELK